MASSRYGNLQIQKPSVPDTEQAAKRQTGPGRPRGKASSPEYVATTLLLKKGNKRGLQIRAIDEQKDMSEIVDSLVEEYLRGTNSG